LVIQNIFPEAVREARAMLSAPNLPPLQVLYTVLINDLDRIEEDFILVLDDFHAIHEDSVHAFLGEVLRHPPQPMHLVLISRKDPFLPISTFRARDQVTEVRTRDLRFTESEAIEFLKFALGDRFEDTTALELSKRTEGWVTGLRLAVLAMGGPGNSVRKLLDLKGTTPYVVDFLITEVLDAQSPPIRRYLLRSSILD
jgi:LuxR family transcriptional regulator, maltose regulon positive regulatory protein